MMRTIDKLLKENGTVPLEVIKESQIFSADFNPHLTGRPKQRNWSGYYTVDDVSFHLDPGEKLTARQIKLDGGKRYYSLVVTRDSDNKEFWIHKSDVSKYVKIV